MFLRSCFPTSRGGRRHSVVAPREKHILRVWSTIRRFLLWRHTVKVTERCSARREPPESSISVVLFADLSLYVCVCMCLIGFPRTATWLARLLRRAAIKAKAERRRLRNMAVVCVCDDDAFSFWWICVCFWGNHRDSVVSVSKNTTARSHAYIHGPHTNTKHDSQRKLNTHTDTQTNRGLVSMRRDASVYDPNHDQYNNSHRALQYPNNQYHRIDTRHEKPN